MRPSFDLVLLHAPSVLDFRTRDDVLFAYLGSSDSVHVSPQFEMPPVGMLALRDHLTRRGHRVGWFNLAARMVRDPGFDVDDLLRRLDSPLFGIDLHWLAHAHGALGLAARLRELHPRAEVLLGGHAASYYADELVRRPEVDLVLRGYNTLSSLRRLLEAGRDQTERDRVPGLVRLRGGEVRRVPLPSPPLAYDVSPDWGAVFDSGRDRAPYHLVIPQAGCRYGCRWCGGSAAASRRLFGLPGEASKPADLLRREMASIARRRSPAPGHAVTMIDFFHEDDEALDAALGGLDEAGIRGLHVSLHRLPDPARLRRMTAGRRVVVELSPDSHDRRIARASGRGAYDMEEMERFIAAVERDVRCLEVYFMIGLPGQTEGSVHATVDHADHLMSRFPGGRVIPFLCPMLPFLDPASDLFEAPERWGYTVYHRTVEEHRRALVAPTWRRRLNYRTDALSRQDLVRVTYDALQRLTRSRIRHGLLAPSVGERLVELMRGTRALMDEVEAADALPPGPGRERTWAALRPRIRAYNDRHGAVARSQQRPLDLGFARRQWYDTDEEIDAVLEGPR